MSPTLPSCASKTPRAKLVLSPAAGSGTWQCVCEGRVGEAASRFVLGFHHRCITAHGNGGSGVILMTLLLRHLGAVGTVGKNGGGTGSKGNFDQLLRSFFFFFFPNDFGVA